MAIYYYGAHSITFTKTITGTNQTVVKNSWADFHLVPSARPFLEIPKVQTIMVKLPRSNKILDITNSLNPNQAFEGSTGSWEYMIDLDKWNSWTEAIDALEDYFDGSEFSISLDDNPNMVYSGMIFLSDYTPDAEFSKVKLEYDLTWKPYWSGE